MTEVIAWDLDIISAEQTVDPSAMKPVLKLSLEDGHPSVDWKKQEMDGIETQVDHGNRFGFLTFDTVPDCRDSVLQLAADSSASWKYRGICPLNDERVDPWRIVSSLSVLGTKSVTVATNTIECTSYNIQVVVGVSSTLRTVLANIAKVNGFSINSMVVLFATCCSIVSPVYPDRNRTRISG